MQENAEFLPLGSYLYGDAIPVETTVYLDRDSVIYLGFALFLAIFLALFIANSIK